ncbi:diguanylate cyclase [Wenzhouxiangella sediminis]|uniref:diguanylate cyclase n=1 Tax=Wenzhouxiangella sediminis TaxID=1792836 RepID=UPI0015F2621D|nr:diguanylate cyclase [Wenzhouxiangella sediminis]
MEPRLLVSALEHSPSAVTIFERRPGPGAPAIVYVNRAFEVMTGYARDEVLGRELGFLRGELTDPDAVASIGAAIADGRSYEGETWFYRKSGEAYLMRLAMTPDFDDSGVSSHFIAVQRDVTERRKRQRRRQDLELIVHLQREIVTGGLDLQRVRQKVVDAALQISGADAAVVEEAEDDEMVYRAVAGRAQGSLGLRLPVEGSLTGLCFRSRELIKTDDTEADPRVHREAARKVGFVSGILVPLIHDQRCYGVLKVYSSRPSAFSSDEVQLLEIASGILAAALFNAASFEAEVNRRSLLVDSIPILVSFIDKERRYREVNAAYEDWFCVKASDIRGQFMWEVLGDQAYERIRSYVDAALEGEEVSYEAEIPYKEGGKRVVLAQYQPSRGHDGEVTGMYAVVRDLTQVKQAELDFLTGLWNRRKCEEKATELLRQADRYDQPLALMLLDVDNFKSINDRFGHAHGDEVLKGVGHHLGNTVRGVDVVGRWGGEEFIILAPETGLDEAKLLAERICAELRRQSFAGSQAVTVSIGVTRVSKGERLEQALERADEALYRAKREGRDRVAVSEPGDP